MGKSLKKFCLLIIVLIVSLSYSPGFAEESPGSIFRGQYRLSLESRNNSDIIFYLRSSGSSGIVKGNGDFRYAAIDFYLMQGFSDLGPSPLPVGHVLITYGSDEETYRLILRLVNAGEGKELKIQVVDAISTFVDGPNDVKDWSHQKVVLERYDPTTKQWVLLK